MGGSLSATNKIPELKTVSLKILVVGDNRSGKTSITRRYIANQFIQPAERDGESQNTSTTSQKLPVQCTHTLKVPGRKELLSVTFWEVPSHPLPYMKQQYYACVDAVIIVIVVDRQDFESVHSNDNEATVSRIMTEAQAWKTDILDNSTSTPQELPMMVLVNKRESETEHGLEHNDDGQESEMNKEYLSDIALKNGFTSCLKVHPHLGDGTVLRAVDSLLRLLMEKRTIDQRLTTVPPYSYPTQTDVPLCQDLNSE